MSERAASSQFYSGFNWIIEFPLMLRSDAKRLDVRSRQVPPSQKEQKKKNPVSTGMNDLLL